MAYASYDNDIMTYMKRIERIPLLTREEEKELARRVRDDNDRRAADKMAVSNLRFVVKIALEYKRFGFSLIDLVQEGNLGLMKAIEGFDPDRGNRLITYAVWWIRAKIHNYIIQNWSLVRFGSSRLQRNIFYRIISSKNHRDHETLSEFTERVAGELNTSVQRVEQIQSRVRMRDSSLDHEITDDGKVKLVDMMTDDEIDHDEALEHDDWEDHLLVHLYEAIDELEEREQFIVKHRYLVEKPSTLQEIGTELGISKERVRQLQSRIVKRLRDRMLQDPEIQTTTFAVA